MQPNGLQQQSQQEIEYERALQAVNIINRYNETYRLDEIITEPIYGYVSNYRGDLLSKIDEFKTIKLQLATLESLIPLFINCDKKDLIEPIQLILTAMKNEINTIETIKHYT